MKLDYDKLENLLIKGDWREADLETFNTLGELCGIDDTPDGQFISQSGLNDISMPDLKYIDKLWSKYSSGHFGYSSQLLITQEEVEGFWLTIEKNRNAWEERSVWNELCNKLRWNTGFLPLDFSLKAPKGHLPATIVWGMGLSPCGSEAMYRILWSKFQR